MARWGHGCFLYYNFGGWLKNRDHQWHGLRHLPDSVAKRIHEIHAEHARTGELPDWCRVEARR